MNEYMVRFELLCGSSAIDTKLLQSVVQDHGHLDGTPATGRQLIWIVVEDDLRIDTDLRQRLQMSGINHLYIAYGPTKYFVRSYISSSANAWMQTLCICSVESRGTSPVSSELLCSRMTCAVEVY